MSDARTCLRCKAPLKEGARFCGNCGAQCDMGAAEYRQPGTAGKRSVGRVVPRAVPIVAVIGVGLLASGWSWERKIDKVRRAVVESRERASDFALELFKTDPAAGSYAGGELLESSSEYLNRVDADLRREGVWAGALQLCGLALCSIALWLYARARARAQVRGAQEADGSG